MYLLINFFLFGFDSPTCAESLFLSDVYVNHFCCFFWGGWGENFVSIGFSIEETSDEILEDQNM